MPKSQYCFFRSRIRARDFDKASYLMDIVIDERDFEEEFCNMTTSCIELDITVENPALFEKIGGVIIIKKFIRKRNCLFVLLVFW